MKQLIFIPSYKNLKDKHNKVTLKLGYLWEPVPFKPRQHVHSLCSFTWANVPMHCKLATKQLKGPKLLRKKFNQEIAAFWRGAKSGFLVNSPKELFDETFSKSSCPSPPVAAEGGFEGGRRHLI